MRQPFTSEPKAEIERTRQLYRPRPIKVLFVGESPPSNGDFFYYGNNNLLRHMRTAAGGPDGEEAFLKSFMQRGWYLDDLVLAPIDHLPPPERRQRRKDARADLAVRIRQYRPLRIVSLLRSIETDMACAASMAKSEARRYSVPFPGQGNQLRFLCAMKGILSDLDDLPFT